MLSRGPFFFERERSPDVRRKEQGRAIGRNADVRLLGFVGAVTQRQEGCVAAGLFSCGGAILGGIGLRFRVRGGLRILQGRFAEAHKEGVRNFPPEAFHTAALNHLFLEENRPAGISGEDARGGQNDVPSAILELHTAAQKCMIT